MAGTSFELTIDDVQARAVLSQWIEQGGDLTGLMDAIGGALLGNVLDRFEEGRGPDGKPWPKSLRAEKAGGQTLIDSARLRNSITYAAGDRQVTVGTNVIYAAIHQFGGVIKAKTAKGLAFSLPGAFTDSVEDELVRVASVTMPPRPFLGFGPEDEEATTDMVHAWMAAPLGGVA